MFKLSSDNADESPSRALIPSKSLSHLLPRKGGGGGGGHGGGGRSSGGRSSGKGGGRSPAARKGAPPAFVNSGFSKPFAIGKKSATPYSDGGGKIFNLDSGSFAGRQAGGGTRGSVYGTSTFGSGYPYGGSGSSFVDYRPFPYVFYPIPLHTDYYGSNMYVNVNDRPGGDLVYAIVQPSNSTNGETYRIVGDTSSVDAVYHALVANCSITNTTNPLNRFTPLPDDDSSQWPVPEQVVQWYRASTFALSLDSYNNTAALASNQPQNNLTTDFTFLDDTPLPSQLNTTFFSCLNYTIGASTPLVDAPSNRALKLGLGLGLGLGIPFIMLIMCIICSREHEKKRTSKGTYGLVPLPTGKQGKPEVSESTEGPTN